MHKSETTVASAIAGLLALAGSGSASADVCCEERERGGGVAKAARAALALERDINRKSVLRRRR